MGTIALARPVQCEGGGEAEGDAVLPTLGSIFRLSKSERARGWKVLQIFMPLPYLVLPLVQPPFGFPGYHQ